MFAATLMSTFSSTTSSFFPTVSKVHFQKGGKAQMLSGAKRGDILWWDPRFPGEPTRSLQAYRVKADDSMTSFEVHNYAPVLAAATPNQYLKVCGSLKGLVFLIVKDFE